MQAIRILFMPRDKFKYTALKTNFTVTTKRDSLTKYTTVIAVGSAYQRTSRQFKTRTKWTTYLFHKALTWRLKRASDHIAKYDEAGYLFSKVEPKGLHNSLAAPELEASSSSACSCDHRDESLVRPRNSGGVSRPRVGLVAYAPHVLPRTTTSPSTSSKPPTIARTTHATIQAQPHLPWMES